jgi:hypothetical protein
MMLARNSLQPFIFSDHIRTWDKKRGRSKNQVGRNCEDWTSTVEIFMGSQKFWIRLIFVFRFIPVEMML